MSKTRGRRGQIIDETAQLVIPGQLFLERPPLALVESSKRVK